MKDYDIYEECKTFWIKNSPWGWDFKEFWSLLGRFDKNEKITLNCGDEIYGSDVSYWFEDWNKFSHGWISAYRHLGADK